MVKPPYFDSNGIKKGAWSKEEDNKLRDYVRRHGHSNWRLVPLIAGLARCGKSCRLRWMNYLKPGLKRGNFTKHEKDLIIKLHAQLGNKWSAIAANLPGRTDNEIKNFWHAHVEKRSKRKRSSVSKEPEIKEGLSHSEIYFCNIIQTESTDPINHVNITAGLYAENLENINPGNNVITEEDQSCYNLLTSPLLEGELIDNFWLCEEMHNMSLLFETSSGGYSTTESQSGDFWTEPLGEEALFVLW